MDISRRVGSLVGIFLLGCSIGAAAGPVADSEIYQGVATQSVDAVVLKAPLAAESGLRIELPVVDDGFQVQSSADAPSNRPMEVGFGRDIPEPHDKQLDPQTLTWTTLEDGSRAAVIRIKSPGAEAIRTGIQVTGLPDSAELRFFALGRDDWPLFVVTGTEVNQMLSRDAAARDADAKTPLLYWTPILRGEEMGMEIFLPADVATSAVRIAMPKVSHIYQWPEELDGTRQLGNALEAMGITDSGSCTIDTACHANSWGDTASAVAKIFITGDSGGTGTCSGTLVNDLDPTSQIPYFLTARHCVDTQPAASTVMSVWSFKGRSCGQQTRAGDLKVVGGGATLLSDIQDVDTTLLRLNQPPPAGVTLAGWDTNAVAPNTNVTSISHPAGDLQKIAFGQVKGFGECLFEDPPLEAGSIKGCSRSPLSVGNNLFTLFHEGMPQRGSSGSAIFRNDNKKIVGVYSIVYWRDDNGNSQVDCGEEVAQNMYGRFDMAWDLGLSTWLGDNNACDAEPGSWAYCFNPACGPCEAGQGDCDDDSQCAVGLVCANDVGANYGFETTVDVCEAAPETPAEPVCEKSPGDWDYCADPACGPCSSGQGDCDANSECLPGLSCLEHAGPDYGLPETVDVCGLLTTSSCDLPVGDWGFCSDSACGPCSEGQGDCDSDVDCGNGLVCGFNRGADYGLDANLDVCVVPESGACGKVPGDWSYCADPACGPCTEGQGDCDLNSECAGGLRCVANAGERYGLPPTMDVCEPIE